jgi:GMP synthase-like glutamine amidotransferase
MNILLVQNDPNAPIDRLGEHLAAAGAVLVTVESPPPTPDGFDGLVVLGGKQSARDDFPGMPAVLDAIRASHTAGRPVLGICLGAQLIARAFGGRVYRQRRFELGYAPLAPTGVADPLLAGIAAPQHVMQWHEDGFDLPPEAVLLLSGTSCPNQAFRLGRATYGFQGHLELSPDTARRWIEDFRPVLEGVYGSRALAETARVRAEIARYAEPAEAFGALVARRWLGLVADKASLSKPGG